MVCSQESLTEAVKKNIDKVYDELSTITEPLSYKKRTAWFVRNDEERQEILLANMMRYTAQQLPEDDFEMMVRKLRLNSNETSVDIKNDETISNQEKLLKLFAYWRRSKKCSATEAQKRFIHVVDLVDLPRIVARLKAMQIYAKAIVL